MSVVIGLFCIVGGMFPALAAFDIGPLHSDDINGPPWLGLAAGGVFILCGLLLIAGRRGPSASGGPLSYVLLALVFGAFAAIGNWIAFGAGPRQCEVAILGLAFNSMANEIGCRIAFGLGAGMIDGCLALILAQAWRRLIGPGLPPRLLEGLGWIVLALALAPILLLPLLWLLGKGALSGYRTYRATGSWPRNESFIARMKARRAKAG